MLDLEAMIGALDPGETQALQRYAPLFLEDAQAELDEAAFELSIDDRSYVVDGSGDTPVGGPRRGHRRGHGGGRHGVDETERGVLDRQRPRRN